MDYFFSFYLFEQRECFCKSYKASYNTAPPPSLIQRYCSLLFVLLLLALKRRDKKDLLGIMQDVLERRKKPECTVKILFSFCLNVKQKTKTKKKNVTISRVMSVLYAFRCHMIQSCRSNILNDILYLFSHDHTAFFGLVYFIFYFFLCVQELQVHVTYVIYLCPFISSL